MDYTKYTERQLRIIEGTVSLALVEDIEIKRLHEKALFNFDADVVSFSEDELDRRSIYYQSRQQPYTEKMRDIIDGRKPIEDAAYTTLARLYYQAEANGDRALGVQIERELRSRKLLWLKRIEGYTPQQLAIIQNVNELHTIHDRAVRGLRKAALIAGDMDIYDCVCEEFDNRGLENTVDECDWVGGIEYMIENGLCNKMEDYELNYARHISEKEGNTKALRVINAEIANRTKSRVQLYTEREVSIINGEIPVEKVSSYELEDLCHRLALDEERDNSATIQTFQDAIQKRLEARFNKRRAIYYEYTEAQRDILEKKTPLYGVNTDALEAIVRKAVRRGESEKVQFVAEEIAARKNKLDKNQPYTDIQQMIINSIKEVDPVLPAIEKIDDSINDRDKALYGKFEEEYRRESLQRTSLSIKVMAWRDAEYWESLKKYRNTPPYTRRQQMILEGKINLRDVSEYEIKKITDKAKALGDFASVEYMQSLLEAKGTWSTGDIEVDDLKNGEIPYEAISVSQLQRLASKAKKLGDIKLYELTQTLLIEKKNDLDYYRKLQQSGRRYYRPYANRDLSGRNKYGLKSAEEWAMDVLESRIDPTYCSMIDLQNIRLFAETLENKAYAKVARMLIEEKKNPKIVYDMTLEEAMNIMDELTIFPINWPKRWRK